MKVNMVLSITELSSLTGKTRPTLYKYINCFNNDEYDDVPYSFIQLFTLMSKIDVKRSEVINYCKNSFSLSEDEELNDLIKYIKNNRNKIDLKKVKGLIEEEINNGK